MAVSPQRDIFFSFFMFTADMKPGDASASADTIRHMTALREMGYSGFDLPIAPPAATPDFPAEIAAYTRLRSAIDAAGLRDVKVSTNVGATRIFDPTSPDPAQRAAALAYLKSRVDITKALGGSIMAGPMVLPYGVFPVDDTGAPLWSDALADWLPARYRNAQNVLDQLGNYAATQNVQLAIEPVDHWETAAPNVTGDVAKFLKHVPSPQVGICIDSAHVVLGSEGPHRFAASMHEISAAGRVHSVHISAPDRGALHDSWIPWIPILRAVLEVYEGPILIEVFNAIPVFLGLLRLTRRKFGIPGQDPAPLHHPDAYAVASEAIAALRQQLAVL